MPHAHPPPLPPPPPLAWAVFHGMSVALLGLIGLLVSLFFPHPWALILSAGLLACGLIEWRGGRLWATHRKPSRRWLCGSQLLTLSLLVTYCLWQLADPTTPDLLGALDPTQQQLLQRSLGLSPEVIQAQLDTLSRLTYILLLGLTLLYQGSLLLYYRRRTS